jgi:hypothetical protein
MGFDLSGVNPKMRTEEPDENCLHDEYSEWLDENPGVYFRNNVWWWRPLWEYVCDQCSDILTEKDMHRGNYNDGHKIGKVKALHIARRLDKLLKKGDVFQYEMAYQEWREQQESKVPYPFRESNVRGFSKFCRESGGFYIC